MAWTMYSIDPLDTLFFRDGRPFVAGEGTDVASRFPPTPLTLQGLVRSRVLARKCSQGWWQYREGCGSCSQHNSCEAEKVVGSIQPNDGNQGTLQIHGPWLLINGSPVLPIPMDLIAQAEQLKRVAREGKGSVQTGILAPDLNAPHSSNLPGALRGLAPPSEYKEENVKFEGVPGFIAWNRFLEYLCGRVPRLTLGDDWWRPSDLWGEELRPGLEVEDGLNRAESGKLYFAKHVRLKPGVSLAVELEGLQTLASVFQNPWESPFGGERRAVVMKHMESASIPWQSVDGEVEGTAKTGGRLKLVLTQMTWFEKGWYPGDEWTIGTRDQGTPQITTATLNGQRVEWVAARMERPEYVGGWNLATRNQKPIRRFVPPGAVFYLQVNSAPSNNVRPVLSLWNSCLSNQPPGEPFLYASIGLGHVLIGTW